MVETIKIDLQKNPDTTLTYSPEPGCLRIIDGETFSPLLADDRTMFFQHLASEMTRGTAIAWGCPEEDLKIRFCYFRNYNSVGLPTTYSASITSFLKTSGKLYFGDEKCITPDLIKSSEYLLTVPPGTYVVCVVRHFGWAEGSQDAPLLNEGVNYTVIFYPLPAGMPMERIKWLSVPWAA